MEEVIKKFLSVSDGSGYSYSYSYGYGDGYGDGDGSGSGYGDGSGSGYGDGSGDGSGYGDGYSYSYGSGDGYGDGSGYGYGDGSGDGYGDGSGDGSGYGVKLYNKQTVYCIDNTPTLIDSVRGNFAKGRILHNNLTLTDCYIARVGNYFAHGETLRQAYADAAAKALANEPIEDRVKRIMEQYPDADEPIEHSELFMLHNLLTGSCEFGRRQFAKEHNLDPTNGKMSIRDFIDLTKNAYGSSNIRLLAEAYGIKI